MKRYYEGHEQVYQRLDADGVDCWGRDDFDNVHMLGFLREALGRTNLGERPQAQALVIGCGTGPLACELSRQGYQVIGMDISPTAIHMARQQAAKRGLTIDYRVGDLCRDPLDARRYDVIVDSHCLHCIVPEEDRRRALDSIHDALTDDGFFILETMMGQLRTDTIETDEEGIVWTAYGNEMPSFQPRVERRGQWFVPQRRLRPTAAALDEELQARDLRIVWRHIHETTSEDDTADYQAICQRA